MYKLVAIDLDGTMLNSYGIVTANTKNTISKIIESGVDVIIASGRPIDSIKSIAKEINSKKYFIAGNRSSCLWYPKRRNYIWEKYVKRKSFRNYKNLWRK